METKVNYTVVGAFVIVLVGVLIFGIIWLSVGLSNEQYSLYEVHMEEAVTGLSPDAPVKYNGVDVGSIEKISLDKENPQQVNLLLKIKSDTPIVQGTRATLNTQGLTGIAYLNLTNKSPDTTPLHARPGEKYPIIETAPSLFVRLDTTISSLSNNLNKVSNSLNELLNPDNQKAIKGLLLNLNQVSINLVANNKRLDEILKNTSQASQQLPNVLQQLNVQTIPMANQALINLNTTSNNLLQITNQIKQNPAVLLRGQAPATPGPGE